MKNQTLVRKYAHGLVHAVKDEAEFSSVLGELRSFLDLFAGHAGLREALDSPFVAKEKKAGILQTVLAKSGAGEKTARFLDLLAGHGRLDLVGDIVAWLPEAWNERLGILTFEVTSVVPLTDVQKDRLRETLEAVEQAPVRLVYRLDPAIVGGLAVRRGSIVYDASLEGNLSRLKEQIQQA